MNKKLARQERAWQRQRDSGTLGMMACHETFEEYSKALERNRVAREQRKRKDAARQKEFQVEQGDGYLLGREAKQQVYVGREAEELNHHLFVRSEEEWYSDNSNAYDVPSKYGSNREHDRLFNRHRKRRDDGIIHNMIMGGQVPPMR